MRKHWLRGLALSLGLAVTAANGQEAWQAPAANTNQPIAIASSKPAEPATGVQLGKPIAIARTPKQDAEVQPASFQPRDPRLPVVRGSSPDGGPLRPMPAGPAETALPSAGQFTWKRTDDVVASSGGLTTAAPPLKPGEPILTPPTPTPVPMGVNTTPPLITTPPGHIAPVPATPFPPPVNLGGNAPLLNSPPVAAATPCPQGAVCTPVASPVAMTAWGGNDDGCSDGRQIIFGVDYLYYWLKGDRTPALVNTAAPNQTLASTAFSSVAYGDRALGTQGYSGARLRGAYWFSPDQIWGIEGSAFWLGEQQERFNLDSFGNPQIGRPFINFTPNTPLYGQPVSELVAGTVGPITAIGSIEVLRRSNFWGFDANLRRSLLCCDGWRFDVFFGYRQLGLDESLNITERVFVTANTAVPPPPVRTPAGTSFVVNDMFTAENRFYGGQVGFDTAYRFGEFTLGIRSSVAVGCTQQTVLINGSTTTVAPGNIVTNQDGGLLAGSGTNIGRYHRKMFGIVPEAGVTLGWDVYDWLRLSAGYNVLYWNNVARPGEQIDLRVNRNFLPNAPTTGTNLRLPEYPQIIGSNMWAHGMSLGLEFRY